MITFIVALLWGLLTGHVATYDNPGQQGIIVQIDATHCIGYEYVGETGLFGNTLGQTGGQCS